MTLSYKENNQLAHGKTQAEEKYQEYDEMKNKNTGGGVFRHIIIFAV
jgi:hypothetical protein